MIKTKPILSLDEQIEHLKQNGVKFNIMNEQAAKDYLLNNNNYFKLTAYRKNYNKHPDGYFKDKYIDLDFAYLVDLAVIDMQIRYQVVHMALDIEHYVKLKLLRKVNENSEDGYQIVQDYIGSLTDIQKSILDGEINRNINNIYCGDIINKYNSKYPIWAFIEIISFGRLVSFYDFCSKRFADKGMKDDYYRLLTCKEIRNASAHSNCILNDLHSNTVTHKTNADVTKELASIPHMNKNFRRNRMSNARIQQLVTLFYTHSVMVTSLGVKSTENKKIHEIMDRIYKNINYYNNNQLIRGTFDFLKLVVDSWFPNE